jgi:DHA2 family multidrug resistance protein-like MFS transporter
MNAQDGLPPRARSLALLVIIPGIIMAVLDGTIVNLALPSIAQQFMIEPAQSIWIINAYQIATLTMLLPLATLGDIVGYRKVYLAGMLIFTLASLACTAADSLTTLSLARMAQGIGGAGIMSINSALVRLIYPRHLLGRGIAINSMVVATTSVAGPTIAAVVLSLGSWPWLFAINIPIGFACFFLGRRFLPANRELASGARFSPLDVVLNGLMFSLIVLGIDGLVVRTAPEPGQAAFWQWLPLTELLAGLVIGVIYVRRQLREAVPLFPLDLLRIPVFSLSLGTSVGAFAAQTLAYISLPFLLLEGFGRSHWQTGLLLSAWPLGIVMMAPVAGRLIGRYAAGLLAGIGLALLSFGLLLLAFLPTHPSDADIVWRMMVCGLGFGLFQSPNNHTILTSAPDHRSGGASGMLSTARLTGQTTGAVMLAVVFSSFSAHDGQGGFVALCLASAFAALASVCSAFRIKTQKRNLQS